MANPNHTLSSLNAMLAKGDGMRQTNGVPGGGKTFNWTKNVAERVRNRRVNQRGRI